MERQCKAQKLFSFSLFHNIAMFHASILSRSSSKGVFGFFQDADDLNEVPDVSLITGHLRPTFRSPSDTAGAFIITAFK